jgi:hypothetical protein
VLGPGSEHFPFASADAGYWGSSACAPARLGVVGRHRNPRLQPQTHGLAHGRDRASLIKGTVIQAGAFVDTDWLNTGLGATAKAAAQPTRERRLLEISNLILWRHEELAPFRGASFGASVACRRSWCSTMPRR